MGNKGNEVDKTEKEKRVYQVGLMLRRKPHSFIIDFIRREWGLERAQAFNYIKLARKEWKKYFEKLKGDGIAYHIAQIRDLKDQAYSRKVIIGKGDKKETITLADLGLVFDITKEEAKLMGIYPAEKHELTGKGGEPIKYIIEKTYEQPNKGNTEEKEEEIKEPKELKNGEYSGS